MNFAVGIDVNRLADIARLRLRPASVRIESGTEGRRDSSTTSATVRRIMRLIGWRSCWGQNASTLATPLPGQRTLSIAGGYGEIGPDSNQRLSDPFKVLCAVLYRRTSIPARDP